MLNGAAGLHNLAGMGAGVRLTLLSTATALELTASPKAAGGAQYVDVSSQRLVGSGIAFCPETFA